MKNNKTLKKVVGIIFGVIFSLFLANFTSNKTKEKQIINILNSSILSIENKKSELSFLNIMPMFFEYNSKDTLLVHKNPMYFEYEIFYDNLLNNVDFNRKMDSEFYEQLLSFKIRHKKLISQYIAKENDYSRSKVKKDIISQISEEKEILQGEINFLKNRISKEDLFLIRRTTFRKYMNFNL